MLRYRGTLNIGRIIGVKNLPITCIKFVRFKSSIQMKNGKSEGITLFTHSINAVCAASYTLFENMIIKSIIKIKMNGNMKCFNWMALNVFCALGCMRYKIEIIMKIIKYNIFITSKNIWWKGRIYDSFK